MGLLGKRLQHSPQKRHDFILYLIIGATSRAHRPPDRDESKGMQVGNAGEVV